MRVPIIAVFIAGGFLAGCEAAVQQPEPTAAPQATIAPPPPTGPTIAPPTQTTPLPGATTPPPPLIAPQLGG